MSQSSQAAGSGPSATFVANASAGDLYEIEAGRIALRRAESDAVRMFAEMMVEHHTTAKHQMQAALMSSEVTKPLPGLTAPTGLDEKHGGMVRKLAEASDDDFDRLYVDQQRQAHQESLELLRSYAEQGDNPQLRSVAMSALPMIQRHLRSIERMGVH